MALSTKNIVIVGDGSVGKTCLLYAFTNQGVFIASYVPTIYEKEVIEIELNNQKHSIKLHDTAGQEEYVRLREVIYKDADRFLLCYSIADRNSFMNIETKRRLELSSSKLPIVLVGTKSGLERYIQIDEGETLRKKIIANSFIECSAKAYENVNEVIYEAIRASVNGIPQIQNESIWCCC